MFPLEINNVLFGLSDFLRTEYINGVPNSANEILNHLQNARTLKVEQEFYPSLGTHTLIASKHRLAGPGQWFYALCSHSSGAFYGRIISYNPSTGSLTFKLEVLSIPLKGMSWTFTVGSRVDFPDYTNSLANQLTTQTTQEGVRQYFEFHNLISPYILFEDFQDPVQVISGISQILKSGLYSYCSSAGAVSISGGRANCTITSADDAAGVAISDAPFFSIATQNRIYFEGQLTTPTTLSSAGAIYKLHIGLKGLSSTFAAPFATTGIGFTYTHSDNSGQWTTATSKHGGGTTVVNSSIAVVANTSYKFKIVMTPSTITFYINGTSIGTCTTNIPDSSQLNNLMHPYILITSGNPSAASKTMSCDYLYLEVYGD